MILSKCFKPSLSLMFALVFTGLSLLSAPVNAKVETRAFTSEQMESDYNQLIAELRCLVCQNQNLADSNAELAQDMRSKVFKMLDQGSSKDEIVDYMVQRYGDFVMYRPPVKSTTFLLWFGPLVFFAVAGAIVFSYLRKQKAVDQPEVDQQQQKKAHSLLDDE